MTATAIKVSFLIYLKNLGLYDYLAFGWLIITFFILVFLSILVARKSSALSLLIIIISLIVFVVSPFLIKLKLTEIQRPVSTQLESLQKLTYSDTLIVNTTIFNHSTKDLRQCLVTTAIIKDIPTSGYRFYLNWLNPIDNQSILVSELLPKEGSMEYRAIFDDYTYEGNVTALIHAECY